MAEAAASPAVDTGAGGRFAGLLGLQRAAGNTAVTSLVATSRPSLPANVVQRMPVKE